MSVLLHTLSSFLDGDAGRYMLKNHVGDAKSTIRLLSCCKTLWRLEKPPLDLSNERPMQGWPVCETRHPYRGIPQLRCQAKHSSDRKLWERFWEEGFHYEICGLHVDLSPEYLNRAQQLECEQSRLCELNSLDYYEAYRLLDRDINYDGDLDIFSNLIMGDTKTAAFRKP